MAELFARVCTVMRYQINKSSRFQCTVVSICSCHMSRDQKARQIDKEYYQLSPPGRSLTQGLALKGFVLIFECIHALRSYLPNWA